MCNANTGLGCIHTERNRKGKRSKNKRKTVYQRNKIKHQKMLLLSLSLRVNGPLPEWLCRQPREVCALKRIAKEIRYIFSITGAMSIGSTLKWCWETGGDGPVHYWRFPFVKKRLFSSETHHFWSLGFRGVFFVVNYGLQKHV